MTVDRPAPHSGAGVPPTGTRRHGRTGRLGLGLAAVVLSLGALSACTSTGTTAAAPGSTGSGTSGTSGTTAATAGAAQNGATQNTAFDQCMAQNGVQKPAGGPTGGGTPPSGQAPPAGKAQQGGTPSAPPGVDATAFQKALAACQSVAGAPPSQ